jgi:phage protein D
MVQGLDWSGSSYPAAQIGLLTRRDDRDLVEKYGKLAAPFFRLEISDQSNEVLYSAESQSNEGGYILPGVIISDVEYDENDCQASMISMTVQNMDMTMHDSRLFAEGNHIDLWMGYDGHQPDYMGRAIITELEPMFESGSIPSLNVKAYDIAHFMMEEGRAEIVPEGTAWFERHRQSADNSGGNRPAGVDSDHYPDTEREADERARSGGGPRPPSVDRNGPQLDLSGTATRLRLTNSTPTNERSNSEVRTTWRQWRPPRRNRNSGKVWREMKDSEIAEAIFASYGIIPFIEATDERARGRTTTREVEDIDIEGNQVRDTDRQRRDDRSRSGGRPGGAPNLSVDEDGPQLDLADRETRLTARTTTNTVTERTGGRRVVQKSGTSDWEFLKKLAKNHGFIVYVFFLYEAHRWIGYWGPPSNVPQQHIYTFKYAQGDDTTLHSLRPRISMRGQKTEIDLQTVDPRSGREQRLRVSMDTVSQYSPEFRGPDGTSTIREPLGNGPEVVLTIHGRRTTVVADRPFTDPEDARRWLMAFWMRHASDFCTAEGKTIIGLPEMRARQQHIFTGIGRIDGAFFITKATHKMSKSGYNCTFSGYRIVDLLEGNAITENDLLTVDENALGESNPVESNG